MAQPRNWDRRGQQKSADIASRPVYSDKHLAYSIANDLISSLGLQPRDSWIEDTDLTGLDSDSFRNHYLANEILSKYDSHDLGINTESVAWEKFHAAEFVCSQTNKRLYSCDADKLTMSVCEPIIHSARNKIARVLGAFSAGEMLLHSRFSNGASTSTSRAEGHPTMKMASLLDVTPKAYKYYKSLSNISAHQLQPVRSVCLFNKATTVPKNSKTDRSIAIEPGWNMFFQLGIGNMIRRRLKRVGIDLNDQSRNASLARRGSINGALATVDLSAASDTISYALVELLLPPDWFSAMDDLRSPYGLCPDGTVIRYEKFSSMGNGFTFELESLIFWAIAQCVCEQLSLETVDLSVYGDDIIVPSDAVDLLSSVFSYCGFTMNKKKTFSEGPFRESCGKHYHYGIDVTPFYIRHTIDTPYDLISVLNRIFVWGTIDGVWDPRVLSVYEKYRAMLPVSLRTHFVNCQITDGALLGFTPSRDGNVFRHGDYFCRVLIECTREVPTNDDGGYLLSLFNGEVTSVVAQGTDTEFSYSASTMLSKNKYRWTLVRSGCAYVAPYLLGQRR